MYGRFGSAHHAAKMKEADVREMRRLYKEGKTIDEIHAQFASLGITHSSVEKAIYRLSWKHVE